MTVHSVTMPVGLAGEGMKRKGRPLANVVQVKRSIIEVRAEENCLAHALVIAIARLHNDPYYKAYSQGRKIRTVVPRITRDNRYGFEERCRIPEIARFQEHCHE